MTVRRTDVLPSLRTPALQQFVFTRKHVRDRREGLDALLATLDHDKLVAGARDARLGFSGRNKVDYAQTVTRRARILIVEDDVDLRRMFRQALIFAGFDVNEAGDGMEALRSIDGDVPDAVILDIGLPLLSGNVVRQEIAAQAHTRQIPVIVVTGQPGIHEGPGAACVLRKPVSADRLIQTVRTCIASGGTSFSER